MSLHPGFDTAAELYQKLRRDADRLEKLVTPECGLDPALMYWWTEESEPRGMEWMKRSVEEDWPSIQVVQQEFTPIRVTKHGEMHFVFYRGARTFKRGSTPVETVNWVGMEVLAPRGCALDVPWWNGNTRASKT